MCVVSTYTSNSLILVVYSDQCVVVVVYGLYRMWLIVKKILEKIHKGEKNNRISADKCAHT